MPKQPFISIPLDIADVRVLKTELREAARLEHPVSPSSRATFTASGSLAVFGK